jgi:hypothetical protein
MLLSAAVSFHAHADCLDDAARYHRVSVQVVRAIAQQESGMRPYVTNRNTDGSEDIGLMQINSAWLPKLRRFGITRQHLFDACVNAYVGTWILASNIRLTVTFEAVTQIFLFEGGAAVISLTLHPKRRRSRGFVDSQLEWSNDCACKGESDSQPGARHPVEVVRNGCRRRDCAGEEPINRGPRRNLAVR